MSTYIDDIFDIFFISKDMTEHSVAFSDGKEKDRFVDFLTDFFRNKRNGLVEIYCGDSCEIEPPIIITSDGAHLPKYSKSGALFFICTIPKEDKVDAVYGGIDSLSFQNISGHYEKDGKLILQSFKIVKMPSALHCGLSSPIDDKIEYDTPEKKMMLIKKL